MYETSSATKDTLNSDNLELQENKTKVISSAKNKITYETYSAFAIVEFFPTEVTLPTVACYKKANHYTDGYL